MGRKPKTAAVKPTPRKRAARPARPPMRVRMAKLEGDDATSFAELMELLLPRVPVTTDAGFDGRAMRYGNEPIGIGAIGAAVPSGPQAAQGAIQRVRTMLGQCHHFVTSIEQLANRVLGSQPETRVADKPKSDGEINAAADMAGALLERLVSLNTRLSDLSPPE